MGKLIPSTVCVAKPKKYLHIIAFPRCCYPESSFPAEANPDDVNHYDSIDISQPKEWPEVSVLIPVVFLGWHSFQELC